MSEYVATDRISQVVKKLCRESGLSVLIECDVWHHRAEPDSEVKWKLSFVGGEGNDCKIRYFKTYQEIMDWIIQNNRLISTKTHPVFL